MNNPINACIIRVVIFTFVNGKLHGNWVGVIVGCYFFNAYNEQNNNNSDKKKHKQHNPHKQQQQETHTKTTIAFRHTCGLYNTGVPQ